MRLCSIHELMKFPLLVAQVCGLFPVRGVTQKTSYKLRFVFSSYKSLLSLLLWVFSLCGAYIIWISERKRDTGIPVLNEKILQVVCPPFIFFPSFLHICRKWRKFVHKWEFIEKKLPHFGNQPNLVTQLRIISIFYIISRLGYILAHILAGLAMSYKCLALETFPDHLSTYFFVHYYKIFKILSPSVWKSVLIMLGDVLSMLQWVSCSLLITALSMILSSRFRLFNECLESGKLQLMPNKYWQEMRSAYNNLSDLTSLLDGLLSPLILVLFTMETLNVIIFIYWTITWAKDLPTYILAVFGFLKAISVTGVTQFSVAAVYEQSRRSLDMFKLVPSVSYSREVKRLYEQVATNTLALTGCQFFFVTRSVILGMLSTVVTYEVVLIQFGSYEPEIPTNSTASYISCINWFIPKHTGVKIKEAL